MAVCHTPHGEIPGKSNGKSAWYCYGGKEVESHNFSYVVVCKICKCVRFVSQTPTL